MLHSYDRTYRIKHGKPEYTFEPLARMTFAEYDAQHATKKRVQVHEVKAHRGHKIRHRAEGLTESEQAILHQQIEMDWPTSEGWIHVKNGGSPDWYVFHAGTKRMVFIEAKESRDRMAEGPQQNAMQGLHDAGAEIYVYRVRKVRKAAA